MIYVMFNYFLRLGLEAHSLDNLTSDLRRQLESQKALVSKLRFELSEMADKEVAYAKTIQVGIDHKLIIYLFFRPPSPDLRVYQGFKSALSIPGSKLHGFMAS